jgi:hypothetical protein
MQVKIIFKSKKEKASVFKLARGKKRRPKYCMLKSSDIGTNWNSIRKKM